MAVNDHSYIIIGGSTKCATSSVFMYLADHPSVSRSKLKESRFFWTGEYPLKKEQVNYLDGIEKYDQLFEDKAGATFRLEATPDYLYSSKTAQLIHENLKKVKLIFIFRDPVSRIISWYKFARQLNLITSDVSIDDYILAQLNATNSNPPQYMRAVEQCRYQHYLEDYQRIFGTDDILVLKYEDLSKHPIEATHKVCTFLGIDESFYNTYDFKIVNQSVNIKNAGLYHGYRQMQKVLRRKFKHTVPEVIRKPISRLFKGVDNMYLRNASSDWGEIKISRDVLAQLNSYFESESAVA